VGQCPTGWPLCRIYVVTSVQRRKLWLKPTARVPCSNAAKTRNPLTLGGVPQTTEQVSAASGPKFAILRRHVGETLVLNNLFPIIDICRNCKDIARQSCAMVPRWRIFGDFLRPVFSPSRVQHISYLYSKRALRPKIGLEMAEI